VIVQSSRYPNGVEKKICEAFAPILASFYCQGSTEKIPVSSLCSFCIQRRVNKNTTVSFVQRILFVFNFLFRKAH